MNNVTEEVRKFVEDECKKPGANYIGAYSEHFEPVHNYAKLLAEKSGADMEIVEISAWLHDIGSIIYERKNHHITGAEIAEKKLRELNYPSEKIEKVKDCILNHRGSVEHQRESKEQEILAEADGMAHFDSINGLFKSAIIEEKLDVVDSKIYVRNKLIRSWNKLSEYGKEIIKPKYDAAMLLLK